MVSLFGQKIMEFSFETEPVSILYTHVWPFIITSYYITLHAWTINYFSFKEFRRFSLKNYDLLNCWEFMVKN